MNKREKLIMEKIAEKESIEMMQFMGVKHIVYEILIKEKRFHPDDVQVDPRFDLVLETCEAVVGIDFVINLEGTSFMVIRCVSSGIESWERYTVAFARAIKDYQIPYAVITDGEQAKVFDILNDVITKAPVQDLFTRQEAINLLKKFQKIPCPGKRREKEKRIIYAFEGIKCQPAKQDTT